MPITGFCRYKNRHQQYFEYLPRSHAWFKLKLPSTLIFFNLCTRTQRCQWRRALQAFLLFWMCPRRHVCAFSHLDKTYRTVSEVYCSTLVLTLRNRSLVCPGVPPSPARDLLTHKILQPMLSRAAVRRIGGSARSECSATANVALTHLPQFPTSVWMWNKLHHDGPS